METKNKIWLITGGFWSFLLCLFLLLNQLIKPTFLPLPKSINEIFINYEQNSIHLKKKGQDWFLKGQKVRAGRVEEVLNKLRTCQNPHLTKKIVQPNNPRPVIIEIARKKYFLDGYNTFYRSHYLNDGEKSWFCDERLKAVLAQPVASWFNH